MRSYPHISRAARITALNDGDGFALIKGACAKASSGATIKSQQNNQQKLSRI